MSPVAVPDPEEEIGKVVINAGSMTADNRGAVRKLKRNSKIFKGDALVTGENSYTQIRMKDGALISLRPKTRLLISDYNFNGREDGTEISFFELVSGGFRTITGLIGHTNKNNYRVRTSVATIGIRGTHYGLMICDSGSCDGEADAMQDGLYGGVVDGSVVVNNDSGEFVFDNDQYFHIASASSKPLEQLKPPPVFHGKNEKQIRKMKRMRTALTNEINNQAEEMMENADGTGNPRERLQQFVATNGAAPLPFMVNGDAPPMLPILNDQNDNPLSTTGPVNLAPPGSGVLIGFVHDDMQTGTLNNVSASVIVGVNPFNEIVLADKQLANGTLIRNIPIGGQEISDGLTHNLVLPSGTVAVTDIGGSPLGVNWGRWAGNYVYIEDGVQQTTRGSMHYIYSDRLTTGAELVALGGLLTTENYTLAGGTTPTNALGQAGALVDVTVTTDFIARTLSSYQIHTQDAGADFFMQNAVPVSFADMNDFNLVDAGCTVSCTGRASAAFVGAQAEGMISSYSISEIGGPKGSNGAAFLTRSGVTIPIQ